MYSSRRKENKSPEPDERVIKDDGGLMNLRIYDEETAQKIVDETEADALKKISVVKKINGQSGRDRLKRRQSFAKVKTKKNAKSVPSDETKLSFVVDEENVAPFHIRYRVNVDKKKGEWVNPLTFKEGAFFSPVWKVSDDIDRVPPPLILSKTWEKKNIKSIFNWNHQATNPVQGDKRVYTISGLTPSVKTGESWGNWLFNNVGQGFYGTRVVEVEFAPEVQLDENDQEIAVKWENVYEGEWGNKIVYETPSCDLFTTVLYIAMNWTKSTGIQQLESAFLGQLQENKGRNSNAVRDFFKEVLAKLQPFWENNMIPWLDRDPNLRLLLKERRESKLREYMRISMDLLKSHNIVKKVPEEFQSLKPKLLQVIVEEVADGQGGLVRRLESKKGVSRFLVKPGTKVRVEIQAERAESDTNQGLAEDLKIWFSLFNKKTKQHIEIEDDDVLMDAASFVTGSSKRLRQQTLLELDDGVFKSEFSLFGTDRHGYSVIDEGTTLYLSVAVEQLGTHEDDDQLIKLKYREDEEKPKSTEEPKENDDSSTEDNVLVSTEGGEKPQRTSGIPIYGQRLTEADVRKAIRYLREYKKFDDSSISSIEFLSSILTRLGKYPTSLDLEILQDQVKDMDDDEFCSFYVDSKWNQSMVQEILDQTKQGIIEKKTKFLTEKLNIPEEKLSTKAIFDLPERKLLQKHLTNLFKVFLSEKYGKMRDKSLIDKKIEEPSAYELAQKSYDTIAPSFEFIDIREKDVVEESTLPRFLGTFARNIFYEALGLSLPFGSVLDLKSDQGVEAKLFRRDWIDSAVNENRSIPSVSKEVIAWNIVKYFRQYEKKQLEESQRSEISRKELKAQKEKKEKKLKELLRNGFINDENTDISDIDVMDLFSMTVREIIKTEVDKVVKEVVPQISSAVSQRVLPAIIKGAADGVHNFFWKNKLKVVVALGLIGCLVFKPPVCDIAVDIFQRVSLLFGKANSQTKLQID